MLFLVKKEAAKCGRYYSLVKKEAAKWFKKGNKYYFGSFLTSQNYWKAVECFQKAVEIDPLYINAWYSLGLSFKYLKHYEKEFECYDKILHIDMKHRRARRNLMELGFIFIRSQNLQFAFKCYDNILQIDPKVKNARKGLKSVAYYYERLGDDQSALMCYMKLFEIISKIDPEGKETRNTLNWMGHYYTKLEKYQNAMECYEKILQIKPKDKNAREKLETLKTKISVLGITSPETTRIEEGIIERPTPPTEVTSAQKVSIKRQFEYIGGMVRVKVKVVNSDEFVITKAKLYFEIPPSFKFCKIEPAYPLEKTTIILDDIQPSSEKTVTVQLEPLICGKEKIYGNLQYLDSKGTPQVIQMNPLEIPVVCPLFFTEDTVNVAILTNLLQTRLIKKDERSYMIPQGISVQDTFQIVKTQIQKHHIRFVSDQINEENQFEGAVWYYGKTKVHQNEFVIVGEVSEQNKYMKVQVACEKEEELTGLLAEIGSDLRKALLQTGKITSENEIVELRCPKCAGPLDHAPEPGEVIRCPWCEFSLKFQ